MDATLLNVFRPSSIDIVRSRDRNRQTPLFGKVLADPASMSVELLTLFAAARAATFIGRMAAVPRHSFIAIENAGSIASKSAFFEKDCRTKHTA
jgi:hypothetical protein